MTEHTLTAKGGDERVQEIIDRLERHGLTTPETVTPHLTDDLSTFVDAYNTSFVERVREADVEPHPISLSVSDSDTSHAPASVTIARPHGVALTVPATGWDRLVFPVGETRHGFAARPVEGLRDDLADDSGSHATLSLTKPTVEIAPASLTEQLRALLPGPSSVYLGGFDTVTVPYRWLEATIAEAVLFNPRSDMALRRIAALARSCPPDFRPLENA